MNKKIGLLNFHYSDHNYGAVLQAAALADVVTQLGYNAEHINFIPAKIEQKKTLRQRLVAVLAALGIKSRLKAILGRKEYIRHDVFGEEVFEQFRNVWVERSQQTYIRAQQLDSIGTTYKSVIVGSDQVWRPSMFINKCNDIHAYFLSFLPDSVKRISYAASFGVDKWEYTSEQELTHRVSTAISKFEAISVREESAVTICRDVFCVSAMHVLDPTLLNGVDFFERIISQSGVGSQRENVVYYKLDVDADFISEIERVGEMLRSPIEDIYYKEHDEIHRYIPVADWLSKIRDSKFVVTDSFHCVCLAILFNKEFICFANKSRGLARVQSLLDCLEIEGRLCGQTQSLNKFFSESKPIDYIKVNKKLDLLRNDSMRFLKKSLAE